MKLVASISCLSLIAAGSAWHYRQDINTALRHFLVGQTKRILKQELSQEKHVDFIAANLDSVVQRFVLENPRVQERTAELMHQLFHIERIKKVFLNLFIKGIGHPDVQVSLKHSAAAALARRVGNPDI